MQTNPSIYSKIAHRMQTLHDFVQARPEKVKIKECVEEFKKTNYQLTSLSFLFRNTLDFGPNPDHLDPPTSGYSSDCYEVKLNY